MTRQIHVKFVKNEPVSKLFHVPSFLLIQNWYECSTKIVVGTQTSHFKVHVERNLPARSFSEYNPIRMIICSLHKLNTCKILPMSHGLKWRRSYLSYWLHCWLATGSFLSVLRGHQVERPNVERIWPKAKKTFSIVPFPSGWMTRSNGKSCWDFSQQQHLPVWIRLYGFHWNWHQFHKG